MPMRMRQWVHMALLALCIAIPTPSWALGLGEIEVESALNERFSGSIELLDSASFQASEVFVSMASTEDFQRVGVERFFYLTNIRFEVEFAADGSAIVNVSSTQPVAEPYLNFIVEVLWPNGRLLKEFTVLLDPPTFSQAAAPAVAAPRQSVAQTPSQPTIPRQTQSRAGTQVDLQPSRSTPRQPPADGLMTSREDTLWKIASANLPSSSVSVHQQMLAIQRKNPKAFINNNINLLKAGYVLEMPTENEALSVGQSDAVADVGQQTENWRSGSTAERLADTGTGSTEAPDLRSQVDASPAQNTQGRTGAQSQGDVRIVANTGELATGTASGDTANVNQLIEEKETLARQVDELTYQLDREKDIAVNQVTVKDRQLEVKDQELAQAQQAMKELREQLAAASQNQNQSPQPTAAETPWWMSPFVLFGVIGALVLILAIALVSLRKSKAERDALYEFDQSELDDQPVDNQFEETVALANEEDEAAEELVEEDIEAHGNLEPFIGELSDSETSEEVALDNEEEVLALSDDDINEDVAEETGEEIAADADTEADTATGTQTGDVIGEAEIYIAYGRYSQAANLLSGVLPNEPDRWDIRLKLLEVFVESHDADSFAEHAQYIVDNCEDEDVLLACRELESQLDSVQLDDDDGATGVEVAATGTDELTSDDDGFALELDDLELAEESGSTEESAEELTENTEAGADEDVDLGDLPLIEDAPIQDADSEMDDIAMKAVDAAPTDGDLDFELEFDGELDDLADGNGSIDTTSEDFTDADEIEVETGGELGGDLGLDFDPDAVTDSSESTESPAEPVAASIEDAGEIEETEDPGDFEFDAEGESDINATKLDLAEAYVDMGDADGAQDILGEVLEEGTSEQKQKAQEMLDSLAS